MGSHFSFNRPHLATAYCDSLEGKGINNARSGLFLAGPRRVGKSTFLIEDLIPKALERDWVPVYVDLWEDKSSDPAHLITNAIKNKMAEYQNKITKLAKTIKIDKVNVMGTTLDFSKSTLSDSITITESLHLLNKLSEKPTILIIDEAQHALTSETGLNTMFAIKSARDQLNINLENPALMLVFTGSNRDKLAHLVFKKNQPFFGSEITSFPLLNQEYTNAFTHWVNKNLAANNQFTLESTWEAFKLVGHRPEILRQIAGRIALSGEANNFAELLQKDALLWHNRIWDEFENDFNTLTPLQKAILEVLINKGPQWTPFSEDSIKKYQDMTGLTELSTGTIQTAIHYLREKDFIWQSGRGSYALEDASLIEWFKRQNAKSLLSGINN